jgi:HEAT repeat protein
MGYRNLVRPAKKIARFEERGDIAFALFTKLAAVLNIDEATIQRLMEKDRMDLVSCWNQWANQPITPHLIVRLAPGFFMGHRLPEAAATPEEMECYASDLAQRTHNKVWLILSRRLSIGFDEDGIKLTVSEATPFEPSEPYTWLRGLRRTFLPTCDGGRIELDGLDAPREHGPKKPLTIDVLDCGFPGNPEAVTTAEMLWQFITTPAETEESQQFHKQLLARKADVVDVLRRSAVAEHRLIAACAIVHLDQSQAELALPVLIEGLKSQCAVGRTCAADACRALGPLASSAVPALIESLENSHEDDNQNVIARNRAIGALEAIGPAAASAIPVLVELLYDIGPASSIIKTTDAMSSAAALAAIGPPAGAAIPVLQDCLNLDGAEDDCIRWLRLTASEAIWRITDNSEPALSIATEMLLGDEEWWLRCHAADLLGTLGRAARPAIVHLRRSCDDEDENVRRHARQALSAITHDRQQPDEVSHDS